MKCPLCGAPTIVKETRLRTDHLYRRRLCFNEHKFTTEERVTRIIKQKTAPVSVKKPKEVSK